MDGEPLYVLIGGHGFMGGAYTAHLAQAGKEIMTVGRADRINDLPDDTRLAGTGRRCIVIDFAYTSVPNSSFSDPIADYSDNLYNVLRHIEVVKRLPVATYVYVSSGGTVYGNPACHVPINEEHRNVPLAPYGITKLACERYALMYREVHGLDVRIVRPSNVYGPGQKPFRGQGIVATVMARLLSGQSITLYGDGSTVRDYLYAADFCTALDDVIERGGNGEIYNLGSSIGVSIAQLLDLIKSELALSTISIERFPARPFDVRYNVLDSTKVAGLGHWRPITPITTGLKLTAMWLTSWLAVTKAEKS